MHKSFGGLCTLFFCQVVVLFAQPPNEAVLEVYNDQQIVLPGKYLYVLEDTSRKLTLTDIRQPAWQAKFVRQNQDFSSKPANPYAYWVKLTVKNHTAAELWLSNENAFVHWLDYHVFLAQQPNKPLISYQTGALRHDSTKALPYVYAFWFPLKVRADETITVYMRMQEGAVTPFRMRIGTLPLLLIRRANLDYTVAGLIGLIVIMLGYNLFLWIAIRDNNYLFYCFYLFTVSLAVPYFMGFQYILEIFPMPWRPWLKEHYLAWVCFFPFSMILFGIQVLKTRQRLPYFHIYLVGVLVFFGVITPLIQLTDSVPYHRFLGFFYGVLYLSYVLMAIASIYLWITRRDWMALIYTLAWVSISFFSFVYLSYVGGNITYTFFVGNAPIWGVSLEILFFSLGLGYRINQMRAANLQLVQEQNQILELRVQKRTTELNNANAALVEANQDLQATNQQLDEQSHKLQSLNETKDKLLAIIGHDLRSPIHALMSVLNLLESHTINQEDFLMFSHKLKISVEHVHFTLNNLLIWANNQMEGIRVNPKVFDLYDITQEVVELLEQTADVKQINLHNTVEKGIKAYADLDQVKLVVINLVANAIKFTPREGVVCISCHTEAEMLQVGISDTGMGIPNELKSRIFRRGVASTRGTANEKGTGLGLLLCKDFVEKNGGRIWVESQPEQGSTFYFTLPVSANPENSI